MADKIFIGDDARKRLLGGAKIMFDSAKLTMGPKGLPAVVAKNNLPPFATLDGVTLLKNIDIKNIDDETLGYKAGGDLLKKPADENDQKKVGGTTTVTVVAYSILEEANRMIAAGQHPIDLKKGVEFARKLAIEKLEPFITKIDEKAQQQRLTQIAIISAADNHIGEVVGHVVHKLGPDGVVSVEYSQDNTIVGDITDGYVVDRGYVSQYMETDNDRNEAVQSYPSILVTDMKLVDLKSVPFLEQMIKAEKREILIFADTVDGEALAMLYVNHKQKKLKSVAVNVPGFGDTKKATLEDIALLTGAIVVSKDDGMNFENIDLDVLGTARKVITTKSSTTIIDGAGNPQAVSQKVDELKARAENVKSEFEKEQLLNRAAKLSGKIGTIKVGGVSEFEKSKVMYDVEDAVESAQSALKDGYVAGGGVTLLNIAESIKESVNEKNYNRAFLSGVDIVINALQVPAHQILKNAGLNADSLIDKIKASEPGFGIDANSDDPKIVDLKSAGIIDSAGVTKAIIENAISNAITLATAGQLVVEVPEKPPQTLAINGMPGGMM